MGVYETGGSIVVLQAAYVTHDVMQNLC